MRPAVPAECGCEFRVCKFAGADSFHIHWKWKPNGNPGIENWSF